MNLSDILDGMLDWVRVVDMDNNILYINKSMELGLGLSGTGLSACDLSQADSILYTDHVKCYHALGRETPCENCISRKAVFNGKNHDKEEIINGKIYSIRSSPVRSKQGDVIAAVEVLRDITETKKMQQKLVKQNKKLKSDLHLAKKLQCSLLPKDLPLDKVDFHFVYRPCEALGGDFLDIFKIDDTHYGIYIADVSGHGVTASMLTVFLRSSFDKTTLSPAEALKKLHKAFNLNDFDISLYITVFYIILNIENNTITFANAGHHALPIIFSQNRFMSLYASGNPIGSWFDEPNYEQHTMQLYDHDAILFHTDGMTESVNKEGKAFSEEMLREILSDCPPTARETVDKLLEEWAIFSGENNATGLKDDITVAVLRLK